MLGTPPQDKLHKHLYISNACEHSWIMMIMVGSKMYKTEYDLKAIMYPAYDTHPWTVQYKGELKYPTTQITTTQITTQ